MLTSQLLIPCCNYQAMYNWFELSNHIPFTKYFEGGVDTLIQQRVLINTQKACTHTQPPAPRTHLCLSHLIQLLYLISSAFKEQERLCTCSGMCMCVCVILHVISKLSNLVMIENKTSAVHWNDLYHLAFGLIFLSSRELKLYLNRLQRN